MSTTRIIHLPYYTEGPATDSEGNIFFTSLAGEIIYQMDKEGRLSEWSRLSCPNGQIVIGRDEHLICEVKSAALVRLDKDGRIIKNELEKLCAGKTFSCPNDLVCDKQGNIYFTDSVRHTGTVFFAGTDGRQTVLAEGLDYPNGILLSADEKTLYIAESYKNRILKMSLSASGISEGAVDVLAVLPFHPSGKETDNLPDGLALDAEGNVWVAHYGMEAVHQYSPGGEWMATVDTGLPLTSNLFFINRDTLVVTGGFAEPGPGGVCLLSL